MTNYPSSPVCCAAEASDAYLGYADRGEILAALNELLEAERAGAHIALDSSKVREPAGYRELMQAVRKDEAHWCAMLTRHIRRLDGAPSLKTGAFRGKAMAIPEPLERLAFLNRGQIWVIRKLEKLMPRVRDDVLHAELKNMATRHQKNITTAEAFLEKSNAQE